MLCLRASRKAEVRLRRQNREEGHFQPLWAFTQGLHELLVSAEQGLANSREHRSRKCR
jgi:hypothetical protein